MRVPKRSRNTVTGCGETSVSMIPMITAAAALEEGVVSLEDRFHCPGYIVVEDRRIRCHKTTGHGAESFVEGIENSCNPVFINVGLRIGADHFYDYFEQFGLLHKTGIDLPGEASTIMHKREKIGLVELATISFGQSFQITPIQLATTVSSIINGGNRVTPHVGMQVENGDKKVIKTFDFPVREGICREETSEKMRFLLEKVVSEGGGNKAYIEGYEIGGKTATSQTLPRSAHKYISSFLGFAPADDPKVLVLVIIRNLPAFIMAVPLRLLWQRKFSKTYCLTLNWSSKYLIIVIIRKDGG